MTQDNLYHIFRQRFPLDSEAPFILSGDWREVSYRELEQVTGQLFTLFQHLGLKPGERLAAQVEKSPMAVFLYLACLRSGIIYVPLNIAYTADELAYFLDDAEPSVFIHDPHASLNLEAAITKAAVRHRFTLDEQGRGSLSEALKDLDASDAIQDCSTDDIAAILYTSGTTGRSKGAMLSHGNLAANARCLHQLWGFQEQDVLLHALPIFHVHGLFVALHCMLLNGGPMHFLPRFDTSRVIALLPESTVFMGVPTYYTRLLGDPAFKRDRCRKMRLFISGSAPLLQSTFKEFQARSGHHILERYGMTETGMLSSNPLNGPRIAGSVGFPLPGVTTRIIAEDGHEAAANEIGVLQVKGPNVCRGYWRKPEKNREDFSDDGYFITGDLVRADSEGRLSIVGRSRDLIISGGLNVYPKEVELLIDLIPGVKESAVFGVPHPDYGEAVVAAVVCPEASIDESVIIGHLKKQLAGFKCPQKVFFLEDLPRNTMAKVQKNRLRDLFVNAFEH